MVGMGTLMAPTIGYGTGGSVLCAINASNTNATTGGLAYRVQWDNAGDISTCSNLSWETATTTTTTVTSNIIQFRTLDVPYTWQTIGDGCTTWSWLSSQPQKTPAQRLREILDSRMAPGILSSCRPLEMAKDIREVRARETLLRVLGEAKYRDFIRRGSISVRGKSGLVYQIFPGYDFTKVYDNGKMVDRLCVVLQGDFPPTDSLIMRYLMILNNEQQFRGYAVKHGAIRPELPQQPDGRSLTEIFRELKKAA